VTTVRVGTTSRAEGGAITDETEFPTGGEAAAGSSSLLDDSRDRSFEDCFEDRCSGRGSSAGSEASLSVSGSETVSLSVAGSGISALPCAGQLGVTAIGGVCGGVASCWRVTSQFSCAGRGGVTGGSRCGSSSCTLELPVEDGSGPFRACTSAANANNECSEFALLLASSCREFCDAMLLTSVVAEEVERGVLLLPELILMEEFTVGRSLLRGDVATLMHFGCSEVANFPWE